MADELALAAVVVTAGVHRTGEDLKQAQRDGVRRGGLGRKLAKSWRHDKYPKGGRKSLGAASVVKTKAKKLIEAFDQGTVISSRDGFYLAIPTDAAPKQGVGRKRIAPSNWPEHRFGPLRLVRRKKGPWLLVVDNQRKRKGKRGGFTLSRSKRALATGNGLATVVMFVLHKQVRLRRRLNVKAVAGKAARRLAPN
ncbi:MAG: hypothetical protein GY717_18810, partial [Rhodobacteraceae bacterium]|nr:hypothetical protein [Paracoccaceae bacterium]